MPKEKLFTIGEFSALTGVGIHSLRYYDEIGALKPEYVDPVSSYRYYGYRQLSRIPAINLCRDAGINLSEFGSFLADDSINYAKLLDESRQSLKHKIDGYRIKQHELDQIERFVKIRDALRTDGEVEADLESMTIWTMPYANDMKANDASLLLKLSYSARKNKLRISPSFYGLMQLCDHGNFSQHSFSLLLPTDDPASNNEGIMTIPAGRYRMHVIDSLCLNAAADYHENLSDHDEYELLMSAALIYDDPQKPLYFAASKRAE